MTDSTNKRDGGEVELLQLPEPEGDMKWTRSAGVCINPEPGYTAEQMQSYARAKVERALAESRAQEAESFQKYVDANEARIEAEARAERLAGALREWWLSKRPTSWDEAIHRAHHRVNCTTDVERTLADAALEQEPQE